ncbi:MAG: 2-amino-4-hydroxy-6-hydroxymethyldihydropteridine diphosphokinase, partial [Deltaproteobacteria bacterium]
GAIEIKTSLSPVELLKALKQIEKEIGRKETFRWGPRIIDLDLLLYDSLTLKSEELTLPHPGMNERDFVKIPLQEINK